MERKMITIRLRPDLWHRLKIAAAYGGISMQEYLEMVIESTVPTLEELETERREG